MAQLSDFSQEEQDRITMESLALGAPIQYLIDTYYSS